MTKRLEFLVVKELVKEVLFVGAQDYKRKLFDELIELPEGTSYNSFIIKGSEKTALIDTVDPSKTNIILKNLIDAQITQLDYIISNHAEQDHSGSIPAILAKYPNAKVVTNKLCKKMLQDELFLDDSCFLIIEDGETLSLGGKTLQFVFTPWVHWPETMCTYLQEEKILFTCDFFGSHKAGEQLFVEENSNITSAMKRYYSEIIMPFANIIKKNLDKVRSINPQMIAPSHGPIFKDAKYPIKQYEKWVDEKVKEDVVVAYTSMHGSSKKIADYITGRLIDQGVPVKQFNLTETPTGEFLMSLVEASGLVLCSPTFLGKIHPNVAMPVYIANLLKPKTKILAYVGTQEWGGTIKKDYETLTSNFSKATRLEPLLIKAASSKEDYEDIDSYINEILVEHELLSSHFLKMPLMQKTVNVKFIHQETPDTKTFVLSKPKDFIYHAGQYAMFGFADKRKIHNKISIPLTIASSPHEDVLRFTIKKNTGYTTAVLNDLKVGDPVRITGPMGKKFTFAEIPSRNVIMLSGGSGIVPFISLLRFASNKHLHYKFTLLNGNRNFENIIYREELDYLSRNFENIFVMNVLSRPSEIWEGEIGHIDKDLIEKYVNINEDNSYLICGPPGLVSHVESTLKDMGVPTNRILRETWEINSSSKKSDHDSTNNK